MKTLQRMVHGIKRWPCISIFALLCSSSWAVDQTGINPGFKANPQLAKELIVKAHKPDLRISSVKIEEPKLIITVANNCLGNAPLSRIRIDVSGAPSKAKPTPHQPLVQYEEDVPPLKAGATAIIVVNASQHSQIKTWQGRSFKIEVNSDGKVAEVSKGNNIYVRPESGPDQAAFPLSKNACTAQ